MCNITYCNERKYTSDGFCRFHSYNSNISLHVSNFISNKIDIFCKEKKNINKIIIFTNIIEYVYYKRGILLNKKSLINIIIDRLEMFNNYIKNYYNIDIPIIRKFYIYYHKMCFILNIKKI